jgi:hypothetical protein
MSMNQLKDPLLDEARAAFITRGVAMNVASRSATREPSLVRAYGCRVSADRRHVTVFVPVPRATAVLDDLRTGGAIAVVFTLPRSHETLQLKGLKADIVPLQVGDSACVAAYVQSFIQEINRLGYSMEFARALASGADDELVGLAFEPTAAFVQTPGPNAGKPLGLSS